MRTHQRRAGRADGEAAENRGTERRRRQGRTVRPVRAFCRDGPEKSKRRYRSGVYQLPDLYGFAGGAVLSGRKAVRPYSVSHAVVPVPSLPGGTKRKDL